MSVKSLTTGCLCQSRRHDNRAVKYTQLLFGQFFVFRVQVMLDLLVYIYIILYGSIRTVYSAGVLHVTLPATQPYTGTMNIDPDVSNKLSFHFPNCY